MFRICRHASSFWSNDIAAWAGLVEGSRCRGIVMQLPINEGAVCLKSDSAFVPLK